MTRPLTVRVADLEFLVRRDSHAAFWGRVASGEWEPGTFAVLDRFLTPECVLVDVGAWIGPVTLYAASRGARCLSLEPDPAARRVLLANVRLNSGIADRIEVRTEAVAESRGEARLGNVTSRRGGDSMSSLLFAPSTVGWPVRTVTLTDVLDEVAPERVGLVKLDVEGAEVEILAAAAPYLAAHRPPLYVSVHPRFWDEPLPRLERLAAVLSSYDHLLTPELEEIGLTDLLDDEHQSGLFELVAV